MQLLETIRFEKGAYSNLKFHQSRMNNSRRELFNCTDEIDLISILKKSTGNICDNNLHKCRIKYDAEIRQMEFIPYQLPVINSLKLVAGDDIEYDHKYFNRDKIVELFRKRGVADDIIIVKNGLITDSSYCNLLFYNRKWLTPTHPLLKGIQRANLLEQEKIMVAEIRPEDLHNFTKVRLINAMIKFEDELDIEIENIYGL